MPSGRGDALRRESAAQRPKADKVCPFRLVGREPLPDKGWTPASARVACLGEKCELWHKYAVNPTTRLQAEGCSLRVGTQAQVLANKLQKDEAARRAVGR